MMKKRLKGILLKKSLHGNYKQTITLGERVLARGIHLIDNDSAGSFGWTGKNTLFRILRPGVDRISINVYSDVPSWMRLKVGDSEKKFYVGRKQKRVSLSFGKTDAPVIEVDMLKPLGWLSAVWNLDWRGLGMKIYDISYRSDGKDFSTNMDYRPRIRCSERKEDPVMNGMGKEIAGLMEFREAVDRNPEKRLEIDPVKYGNVDITPLITTLSLERNVAVSGNEKNASTPVPSGSRSERMFYRRLRILVATCDDTKSDVKGGNQMFAEKLVESINRLTPHTAELHLLPFRSGRFFDFVSPYIAAFRKRADDYDAVISVKFPSFCINHPCHVSLLNHRFKAFYSMWKDSFEEMSLQGKLVATPIRKLMHKIDRHYLKKAHIIAQSGIIKKRLEKHGLKAEVGYPPSMIENPRNGNYSYFLLPGRHDDRTKRIHMGIDAMKHFKGDAKLIITGSGRDNKKLKKLAGNDRRIEFTGYVDSVKMRELYSNALAVIFTPFDEDYGLVTIDAFRSGKPVITCSDSGGPTEFVRNLVSGFVVSPGEKAIARCMDYLYDDPAEARRMGLEGFELVKDTSWENYTAKVCSEIERIMHEKDIRASLKKEAEEDLIIRILAGKNPEPPRGIDWNRFSSIVIYNHISQHILRYRKLPKDIRNKLQIAVAKHIIMNKEFLKLYATIKNEFERRSVKHLPLKGINMLLEGDLERMVSDVDILISEKHSKKIRKIMEGIGLTYIRKTNHKKHYHEDSFIKRFPFAKIRRKWIRRRLIEVKTRLDRHLPLTLEEIDNSPDKKEILFCFEMHHAIFDHHYRSIRWLYEINQKLKNNEINLVKAERISQKLGMKKTFQIGLAVTELLFSGKCTLRDRKTLKKAEFIIDTNNMLSPMYEDEEYLYERVMRIMLSENIWEKINHVKNTFFTPRHEIKSRGMHKMFADWKSHIKNRNLRKKVAEAALA